MSDDNIKARKDSHLDLAFNPALQSANPTGFDRVLLTHQALPEMAMHDVDISAQFLGKPVSMPLLIGAMTGGTPRGEAINRHLAHMAQRHGLPLAVGSQRAAIMQGQGSDLRDFAKTVPLIANIGGLQLLEKNGLDMAQAAVDMLQADALFIHLNPLQEAVQPEGGQNWQGLKAAIHALVQNLSCPVMVKEVGAGLSAYVVEQLYACGVRYFDVAGLGGTNWTQIEQARLSPAQAEIYAPFAEWGISTVDAVQAIHAGRGRFKDMTLIASGGVRHGLDVVKAIWLGADLCAAAYPFLQTVMNRPETDEAAISEALDDMVARWQTQIRLALFLSGAKTIASIPQIDGKVLP